MITTDNTVKTLPDTSTTATCTITAQHETATTATNTVTTATNTDGSDSSESIDVGIMTPEQFHSYICNFDPRYDVDMEFRDIVAVLHRRKDVTKINDKLVLHVDVLLKLIAFYFGSSKIVNHMTVRIVPDKTDILSDICCSCCRYKDVERLFRIVYLYIYGIDFYTIQSGMIRYVFESVYHIDTSTVWIIPPKNFSGLVHATTATAAATTDQSSTVHETV